MKKIFQNKNFLTLTYKLLHDSLVLLVVSFAILLIIEGALPGFVSSHISIARIAIALIFNVGATAAIGQKLQITYEENGFKKNKLLPALVVVSFLLIGNSLLRFALWENLIISITTIAVFFLFYEIFFFEKD